MTDCHPRNRRTGLAALLTILLLTASARADLDTDPYLFTEQPLAATGTFEWDEFSAVASFAGPHVPDVASTGTGSAEMTVAGVPQPMDGPPFGLVASTQNLYTGGTIGHWDIDLANLATAESNTTVVLQVATLGPLDVDSFALDGMPPTSFVDRGVAPNVVHDTDTAQAEFDTLFYWVEWQVPVAADYLIEFSGVSTHLSFTGARVDYFNTADVFAAAQPGRVPEPSTLALAGIGLCGVAFAVRSKRRNGGHSGWRQG